MHFRFGMAGKEGVRKVNIFVARAWQYHGEELNFNMLAQPIAHVVLSEIYLRLLSIRKFFNIIEFANWIFFGLVVFCLTLITKL
jgi:hypothetical protein